MFLSFSYILMDPNLSPTQKINDIIKYFGTCKNVDSKVVIALTPTNYGTKN